MRFFFDHLLKGERSCRKESLPDAGPDLEESLTHALHALPGGVDGRALDGRFGVGHNLVTIVPGPEFGIFEYLVRNPDALPVISDVVKVVTAARKEAPVSVPVRMEFAREVAVGLFDRGHVGVPGDFQNLVWVDQFPLGSFEIVQQIAGQSQFRDRSRPCGSKIWIAAGAGAVVQEWRSKGCAGRKEQE